ncbi:MAG: hypothetical protein IPI49_03420 [Myxococcales bacterium]|nr:hypothetical protein [Myxococcales bacterium]
MSEPRLFCGRGAQRCALVAVFTAALGALSSASAGTVTGRVELPPPEKREPSATRGYLDPSDNAILPVQAFSPTPYMVVVLEASAPIEVPAPPQAIYELRGESFARPVLAVVKGQEVLIKNVGLAPRSLSAKEDPNLLPKGTLNVTGTKSFRVAEAGKLYTLVDPAVPHLVGRVISVATPYRAYLDREGRFSFDDVAEGSYKLRVFFQDRWLPVSANVAVGAGNRAKVETRISIPADYRAIK